MQNTVKYILEFLLGTKISQTAFSSIAYSSVKEDYSKYKLVILPSGFFNPETYGKPESIPALPLPIWEEVPILFGSEQTEKIGDTLVIHADLVASTYFLISRYEEMVRRNVRDAHKRFPGKESIPYKAGFIDKPIIEEWGSILRKLLREQGIEIAEPPQKISKVYLTHDVDRMGHYRNVRGLLGGLLRGLKRPSEGNQAFRSFFGSITLDPWYTFPYMYKLDMGLQRKAGTDNCEVITFFRTGISSRKEDKPVVNIHHPDHKTLIKYTRRKGITFGLHTSYEAGCTPSLIPDEKKKLEKVTNQVCNYNRNHYLNNREPEDFEWLLKSDITGDFSMGYADMAGFRLGTCRSVHWINPATRELTNLILHPLTIMDVSLSDKRYMYMNAHDAYNYCSHLISTIEKFNGELSLLWHNDSCEKKPSGYHRHLYRDLLLLLQNKFKSYSAIP